jgi:signal transduction histidine kinase/CheY-like chemotaxis protein
MERSELEAYLQNLQYFPTKGSLLEFARRYNVPVNARTQREEIVRLCVRMIYDIPTGFAGLRAAEKEPLPAHPLGAETRKVLEDFFTGTKTGEYVDGLDIRKITNSLLESILRCHEVALMLAQVRHGGRDLFTQALEACESPIETHGRLLCNLIDFSRLEAGKLKLTRVPFCLRDSLGDALKRMAPLAHHKGVELCYEVKPDVPDTLVGDPVRLQQIVTNLVDNAIKFTEQGEVVVEVQRSTFNVQDQVSNPQTLNLEPGTLNLHFAVRDTGVGIAKEKQRALSRIFSQTDNARKPSTAGFGLAIASRLVELMGGQMEVRSEVGTGSTFSFTVRLQAEQPTAAPPDTRLVALQGRRVLVVDDNATHRRILQELLSSWGLRPQPAASGREALSWLYKAQGTGASFSLVLIDGHLSDVDGFALLRLQHLKEDPALVSPLVMMLASTEPAKEAERCRELEAAASLSKPIKPSELLGVLVEVLNTQAAPAEEEILDRSVLLSLVADDVDLLRELIPLFWQECPQLLFDLQHALLTEDLQSLRVATHTLKGMVSCFAAPRVSQALAVIEQWGQQGNFVHAREAVTGLIKELSSLKPILARLAQELTSALPSDDTQEL